MSATPYLSDHSFSQSLGQPMVVQPIVSQPVVSQPVVGQLAVSQPSAGWPSADQPGVPILPLLSLWLQPDLNTLTWTLTPQALWYVHIGIQIGRTLSN